LETSKAARVVLFTARLFSKGEEAKAQADYFLRSRNKLIFEMAVETSGLERQSASAACRKTAQARKKGGYDALIGKVTSGACGL